MKLLPWPEKQLRSNDVRQPTAHTTAVSLHHPGGIETLDDGEPCSRWPSQPKNGQELENIFCTKLEVLCLDSTLTSSADRWKL